MKNLDRSWFVRFRLWNTQLMFTNSILGGFLINRRESFRLRIALIKYRSLLRISQLNTLSESSFFEDTTSCTIGLSVRMQLPLRTFSFSYSFQTPPKILQKESQISFHFLGCKCEQDWQPNCSAKDIVLRCSDLFFEDQSKLRVCRPFPFVSCEDTNP